MSTNLNLAASRAAAIAGRIRETFRQGQPFEAPLEMACLSLVDDLANDRQTLLAGSSADGDEDTAPPVCCDHCGAEILVDDRKCLVCGTCVDCG